MDTAQVTRGVVFIAYGLRAQQETAQAAKFLAQHNDLPVVVIGEDVLGLKSIDFLGRDSLGRWAKVNLDNLTPFEYTLYLDADTRVHGDISAGFDIIEDGWDIAMTPSTVQGDGILWHIDKVEREATFLELGRDLLQLQGGVMFFRKSAAVTAFFEAWRYEWERWQGQDQGALLRALHQRPVKLWLLNNEWNGGGLIEHRYGAAKHRP